MCNLGMDVELNGVKRGIQTGIAQGREQSLLESIKKMIKNLGLTAQQAMDTLEIPKDDQARYAAMLDSDK